MELVSILGTRYVVEERHSVEEMEEDGLELTAADYRRRGIKAWAIVRRPAGRKVHMVHEGADGGYAFIASI